MTVQLIYRCDYCDETETVDAWPGDLPEGWEFEGLGGAPNQVRHRCPRPHDEPVPTPCFCGRPGDDGVVHRTYAPCYNPDLADWGIPHTPTPTPLVDPPRPHAPLPYPSDTGPSDNVVDPRTRGSLYLHPVNLHDPPPPPPGSPWHRDGKIPNRYAIRALQHRLDHGVDYADLNAIITTLNSIIDVVNDHDTRIKHPARYQ